MELPRFKVQITKWYYKTNIKQDIITEIMKWVEKYFFIKTLTFIPFLAFLKLFLLTLLCEHPKLSTLLDIQGTEVSTWRILW